MIPQYYFNSLSRQMPLSTETPILPLENDDEIFDNRQQPGAPPSGNTQPPSNPTSPTQIADFTQGYLQTQIGKRMRLQFLIGSNAMQDRVGVLTQVGIDYLIIRDQDTNNLELCDLYALKFADIYL